MAQIIKEIRVDVSQPNVFQAIVAKQNDCNSRFLKVTLTDCGVKINIESTAKVTINANRPDGESQSFVGQANNDGTVTVPLAQWMLLVVGLLKCDVSVIDTSDGERLTTTTFYVDVQEAANSNTDYSENPEGEFRVITPVTVVDENSTDDKYPSAKAVYSYGQDILADTKVTASASGKAITIESSKAPLQNLKLFGKTEQDGTPTPTEPKELKSVGDSGSFTTTIDTKNLLNVPQEIALSSVGYAFQNVPIFLSKGDYVFSCEYDGNKPENIGFSIWNNDTTQSLVVQSFYMNKGKLSIPFTIETGENLRVYLYQNSGQGTIKNCQIELGTQATPYEKPNKQTLTMPYTLQSDKSGLADEIDFTRGVLVQRTIKLSGFIKSAEYTNTDKYSLASSYNLVGNEKNSVLCNVTNMYAFNEQDYVHIFIYEPLNAVAIYVPKGYDNTSNPIEVIATLKTPIETPLTETELNAYRQLMTNSGSTTILSEADMTLDYYVNKPNAQSIGRLHEQINKDYFKLTQAIIETGGN